MAKLSDICNYGSSRVAVAQLDDTTYISTENMLPNRGGITKAATLPTIPYTQAYSIGDVLVSNIRPYFKKVWQASWDGGCSNDVLVFQAKPNTDADFLYYVLSSDEFFAYSMATSKGTKMPRGDKAAIMQYDVPDFDLPTQQKIAAVLRSLDCKIDQNKQINDNLLQQAVAVFESFFTNSPDLDQLSTVPLSSLCTVLTKGTTPTTLNRAFTSEGINFIKAESILDNHSFDVSKFAFIDNETNALLQRSIIHAGDILFTIAGTLGRFAMAEASILPANTNQAVAIIRADLKAVTPEYLYSFFVGNWHNDYYSKRIQQAVQANLSLTTIKSLPIPILPSARMHEYLSIITPIFQLIKHNELNNRKLCSLRDSLLPKLMSGEVDVSEVDF